MTGDDDALGRLLEALMAAGGASEALPNPSNLERDDLLAVAAELLRRGWIDASAPGRANGRLFAIRNIRVTAAGRQALGHLRASSGRSAVDSSKEQTVSTLDEKRSRRLLFMRRLYDVTNGSKLGRADMWELGEEFGWSRDDVQNVVEYLEGEGLLEYAAMGGVIAITHFGVVEVEQSLSDPEAPTEHFPPSINVIHVEKMYGSQIQQGTVDSVQEGNFLPQGMEDSLRNLLSSLRRDLSEIELGKDDRSELETELATAELQLESGRPKRSTIRTSLTTIGELLTKATVVSGSSVQLATHIQTLHEILPGV